MVNIYKRFKNKWKIVHSTDEDYMDIYLGENVNLQKFGLQTSAKKIKIGDNTTAEEYCTVGSNVKIGNNTKIGPRVYINNNVSIGNNVTIKIGSENINMGSLKIFLNLYKNDEKNLRLS